MDVRLEQQDNEDSVRGALGSTLRYLREKAGRSLSQLADDTNCDRATCTGWKPPNASPSGR